MAELILDDHGIEVIRKSGFVNARGNYALRTGDDTFFNTIDVQKTTIGTTATRIITPNWYQFFVVHKTAGSTIYLGDSSVTTSTGFPIEDAETFTFDNFNRGDDNEIYGIVASGTVDLYAVGSIKE